MTLRDLRLLTRADHEVRTRGKCTLGLRPQPEDMDSFQPFIPLVLCFGSYELAAVLVQLPNTFFPRIALLPVSLYLSFHAITTFDAKEVFGNPRLNYMNYGTGVSASVYVIRANPDIVQKRSAY